MRELFHDEFGRIFCIFLFHMKITSGVIEYEIDIMSSSVKVGNTPLCLTFLTPNTLYYPIKMFFIVSKVI